MIEKLRQLILALNIKGQRASGQDDLRRHILGLGAMLRRTKDFASDLGSMSRMMDLNDRETESWIGPEAIRGGTGGGFDARELRVYLALAERCGIPFIPAREILVLDEEEMNAASGEIEIPDNLITKNVRRRLRKELADVEGIELEAPSAEELERQDVAKDALRQTIADRIFDAMDDVPENWMVRSNLCGSSDLKALAGSGIIDEDHPQVEFGPDLEVGPGWIRNGNRRRVNTSDARIVSSAAQGARDEENVFLARPWMKAARRFESDDPHRHGSPFAGKGSWPAEWRAFVENGKVRGVSFYYSWAGEESPENARVALEVRDLAQRVADEATAIGAWPRSMDMEFLRANERAKNDPRTALLLERFPREGVAFTLDFMEVDGEGLMLLEGGPAHTPLGMGHSCGFTGMIDPAFGNCMLVDGVAFRTMPGIHLAETSTWSSPGPREGCIATWEEVEDLAYRIEPDLGPR